MALQYTPRQQEVQQTSTAELAVPEVFDPAVQHQEMAKTLTGTPEIDRLVSQICVNDPQTIVSFGDEVASEIEIGRAHV